MKKLYLACLSVFAFLILSCDKTELCEGKGNDVVYDITGTFYFDERFDRYVVDDFAEGSIDARKIYILCNVSQIDQPENFANTTVTIGGNIHVLDDDLKPLTIVAGEEFFVVSSIEQFLTEGLE